MPSREEFQVNTIIGPRSFIQGDISAAGFTRVDGSVQGNVQAEGRVIIGDEARVKAGVRGTTVTINGVVVGDIIASKRLTIMSNAVIIGDCITRRIRADMGCIIQGKVRVIPDERAWEEAVKNYA
ncbi:MAG: polymer-forming cytoskeletal protein [Spirochaetaceae bacterium]|jgi:cytoskeletal protein CcmA (bactofilin family)|nr:polymer-forming cytoskeletal protein [Spirochaetaceae bacterium]